MDLEAEDDAIEQTKVLHALLRIEMRRFTNFQPDRR